MFKVSTVDAARAARDLQGFIPKTQMQTMGTLCRGEEGDFFRSKFIEFAERIKNMPQTYEQDGMGDDAIAYLHYFSTSGDWYITEKDMEPEQLQAFGYANLGHGGEIGYISLVEICSHGGVELDLHFEPTRIGDIKRAKAA